MEVKRFKVVILGDSMVGKTHFLQRYTLDSFEENYITTIGSDKSVKTIKTNKHTTIELQLWDTAGQERYQGVLKSMIQGSHGVIILYDITYRDSFDNIATWISLVKDIIDPKSQLILIGHKCDMEESRAVSQNEGETKGNELGMKFFECSAKNNINIKEAFNYLIKELETSSYQHRKTIIIDKHNYQTPTQKPCCK